MCSTHQDNHLINIIKVIFSELLDIFICKILLFHGKWIAATFHGEWVEVSVEILPCPLDLNLLDFYLCKYLKKYSIQYINYFIR